MKEKAMEKCSYIGILLTCCERQVDSTDFRFYRHPLRIYACTYVFIGVGVKIPNAHMHKKFQSSYKMHTAGYLNVLLVLQ